MKDLVIVTYAMLRPVQDLYGDAEQEGFLLQAKMVVDENGKFCYDNTRFFNSKRLLSIDLETGRCESQDTVYQIIPHAEIQVYEMVSVERSKQEKSSHRITIRTEPELGDNNTQLKRW